MTVLYCRAHLEDIGDGAFGGVAPRGEDGEVARQDVAAVVHAPAAGHARSGGHEGSTHFMFTLERNLTVGATSGYLRNVGGGGGE